MSDQNRATLVALVSLLVVFGVGAYLAAATLADGSIPLALARKGLPSPRR